ncbi:MAG: asparaginase [Oscillospiraceae bacterium]|nr:asparaginase [Oscillospiraceae bacterium]
MRKILVIGTGGTISCAETENGLTPAVSAAELVKGVGVPVELYTEQLFELDSTNMTPRHREALARRIRERYDEFDGFVVTHGTDTMAYAASELACLIQNSRKPVVLTGSMKPMLMKNSDAPKNLADAVRFAADERAFGVRVVFGGLIFDGRSVSKRESDFFSPFDSMNLDAPEEYDVNSGEIVFKEKSRGKTRFYERLSDGVFLAKLIPGQALTLPESAGAVILEGYGLGGVPEYLLNAVERLVKRGAYVIIATQCRYGGTQLRRYEVGRAAAERFSLLETGKMTVEYAVARARWALEYSNGFEEFRELFCDPDFYR